MPQRAAHGRGGIRHQAGHVLLRIHGKLQHQHADKHTWRVQVALAAAVQGRNPDGHTVPARDTREVQGQCSQENAEYRALLAGGLLAFALSFDEVIVTTFTTGGGERTIPIWILQNYTRTSGLPIVNAVALILIMLSVIPVYFAQRLAGGEATGTR